MCSSRRSSRALRAWAASEQALEGADLTKGDTVSRTLILCVVALPLLGCAYTAGFVPVPELGEKVLREAASTKMHKSPSDIVLMEGAPTQNYVVLGTLHAPQVEWTAHYTMEDLVNAVRKKASQLGADAVINLRSQQHMSNYRQVGGVSFSASWVSKDLYGEVIVFRDGASPAADDTAK